jgi:hypothetical protein
VVLLLCIALAVGLAACSESKKSGSNAGRNAESQAPATPTEAQTPTARSVISVATLVVRTQDVLAAAERARVIASDAGGFLSDQETSASGDPSATVTLKVPPDRFDSTVSALSGIGTVTSTKVTRDDVTGQVVDLDGRVKTSKASVDRLRALIASAGSTSDIVTVEHELSQREAELESLLGQQRVLSEQVGLGTITVTFSKTAEADDEGFPTFTDGLRAGGRTLVAILEATVLVVGVLIPLVPLVVVVAAMTWLVVRWRRRRSTVRRPPPPGGGSRFATPPGPRPRPAPEHAQGPTPPPPAPSAEERPADELVDAPTP